MTEDKLKAKIVNIRKLVDRHGGILNITFPNQEAQRQFFQRFTYGYSAIRGDIKIEEEEGNIKIEGEEEEEKTIGYPHSNDAWQDYKKKYNRVVPGYPDNYNDNPPKDMTFEYGSRGQLEYIILDGVRYHLLKMDKD